MAVWEIWFWVAVGVLFLLVLGKFLSDVRSEPKVPNGPRMWRQRSTVRDLMSKLVALAIVGLPLLLLFGAVRVVWLIGVLAILRYALVGGLCIAAAWMVAWLITVLPYRIMPWRIGPWTSGTRFYHMTNRTIGLSTVFVGGLIAYSFVFAPSALQAAQGIKDKIDADENTLGGLNAEVRKAITSGAPQSDLDPDTASIVALLTEVKRLRANADKLLADHQKYVDASHSLSDSLSKAPDLFRKVSEYFTAYAKAEPYAEIRDDYLVLAGTWLAHADRAERRAAELKAQEPQLNDSLDYLKRSALFLRRLEQALGAYPASLASGAVREKFLGQYRQYVTEYEALRQRVRQFHDETKTPPAAVNVEGGAK
jgi:hypothetical protein